MKSFESEGVPLMGKTPISKTTKRKVMLITMIGVTSFIMLTLFATIFSGSGHVKRFSWIKEDTPLHIQALKTLREMQDMETLDNDLVSQINQINYRANSLDGLTDIADGVYPETTVVFEKLLQLLNTLKYDNKSDEDIANLLKNLIADYASYKQNYLSGQTLNEQALTVNQSGKWFKNKWWDITSLMPRTNYIIHKLNIMDYLEKRINQQQKMIVCPTICSEDMSFFAKIKSKFGYTESCVQAEDLTMKYASCLPSPSRAKIDLESEPIIVQAVAKKPKAPVNCKSKPTKPVSKVPGSKKPTVTKPPVKKPIKAPTKLPVDKKPVEKPVNKPGCGNKV